MTGSAETTKKYVSAEEAFHTPIHEKTDEQIEQLIVRLSEHRIAVHSAPSLSNDEAQIAMLLCATELNARSSSELAKTAINLSKIAIGISVASILFGVVMAGIG